MRICLQWTERNPDGWAHHDSSEWSSLVAQASGVPNNNTPPPNQRGRYLYDLTVQGMSFGGYDHYHVAELNDGSNGIVVTIWNDDPDDWFGKEHAQELTILPLAQDPDQGMAYNTRMSRIYYADVPRLSELGAYNPATETPNWERTQFRPWAEFTPPTSNVVHGLWVSDQLSNDHVTVRGRTPGWREWTETLPSQEVVFDPVRGVHRLRDQRAVGRWPRSRRTKTFYQTNTNLAIGYVTADNEKEASLTNPNSSFTLTANIAKNTTQNILSWTSESGEPNDADWPSGDYRARVDITTLGADCNAGIGTGVSSGSVIGNLQSDLSTLREDSGWSTNWTTTGLKTLTASSWNPGAGASTDRFVVVVYGINSNHMDTQSVGIDGGLSDNFIDGPWSSGQEIDAQPGSVSVTGVAATLEKGISIDAQPGSVAVSGVAATLEHGYELDAQPGSVSATGVAATLRRDANIDAQPGAVSVSGVAATLGRGVPLDAQPGSVSVTGVSATLQRDVAIDAQPAAYIVTGVAAELVQGADEVIDAQPGSITITGVAATLERGYQVDAQPESVTVTGIAATLQRDIDVDAQPGTISVAGVSSTLQVDVPLDAQPGAITITGIATTLERDIPLDAQPAIFTVTGVAAGLLAGRVIDAEPATYTVTGIVADLVHDTSTSIDAQPGAYSVTGVVASIVKGTVIDAQPGTVGVTGLSATLQRDVPLDAQPTSYAVSGVATGLLVDRVIDAQPGSVAATGVAASLLADRVIDAQPGSVLVSGVASTLQRDVYVEALPGVYTVSGVATGLLSDHVLDAQPGIVLLSGVDATLAASTGLSVRGPYTVDAFEAFVPQAVFEAFDGGAVELESFVPGAQAFESVSD